jgi:sirohydrochlorin ferrochelatase
MKSGYIVLGHGSRASIGEANAMIFAVADRLKTKLGAGLVETAIINRDSALPGLQEGVLHLVAAGVQEIVIAPLFLAGGMHVRNGIPEEIARLQLQYPQLSIKLAEPLGADPRIADILLERIREAQK